MRAGGLLDTGPLLGFLGLGLRYHDWVISQWKQLPLPLLSCEAVLTEAAFLLKREGRDPDAVFKLMELGVLRLGLHIDDEWENIRALMRRYRDRPMSLADACLVRMSELYPGARILTFDSDFLIHRRHGNKPIPVSMSGRAE
jgi:uncharacterized protein